MKISSKAALLSGLVFPGLGHMILKQYLRGSVLALLALVAFSIIVTRAYQRALTIVDRVIGGEVPADTAAIAEMVSNSTSGADGFVENIAVVVLVVCWLVGIFDSYRLGVAQEKIGRTD
jgi:hypothetical protein